MVQNKMYWVVHRHTAAELIIEHSNAEKEYVGLTIWDEYYGVASPRIIT